jgi:hypothetical protein
MGEKEPRPTSRVRALIILVLIIALAAAMTYAVMSDTSVRGLTVKMSNPTRTCPIDPLTDAKIVTFSLSALVYSTHSLRTSISQVRLQLSANGVALGIMNETDRGFDPGQGTSYTLSFRDPSLDPSSLPASPMLVLAITAQVSAGIYSMKITASDSQTVSFGAGC